MFIPEIVNGSQVGKGQELGLITDTYAKNRRRIKAPFDGHILCINHQAVVNQGDALFHIGR
jgi:predicted deacylase